MSHPLTPSMALYLISTRGDGKGRSRFPAGMTERKITAKTTAEVTANMGVSPLRCASVEMTGFAVG